MFILGNLRGERQKTGHFPVEEVEGNSSSGNKMNCCEDLGAVLEKQGLEEPHLEGRGTAGHMQVNSGEERKEPILPCS